MVQLFQEPSEFKLQTPVGTLGRKNLSWPQPGLNWAHSNCQGADLIVEAIVYGGITDLYEDYSHPVWDSVGIQNFLSLYRARRQIF